MTALPSYSLPKSTLWLMTIATGLIVANNYYNQPLLALIAADFDVKEAAVSKIPMFTQIGYAFGLLFIIPLADMLERKRIIMIDFIFIIGSLLGMAFAPNLSWVLPLSFLIGFSSVIPQMFVPMAAELSKPEDRSSAIGLVMSGLLIGILLSRVFSGFIGAYLGWREMYLIAAGIMLILWGLIALKLPQVSPNFKGNYMALMQSVWNFAKSQPVLQLASFRGAMGFASFSAFWTTLVFHLEGAPFFDGPAVAGSFGIVGAVGALAAAFVGKLSVKMSSFRIVSYALFCMLISWLIFYGFGYTYMGLIIGIIFIDLGLQSMHIMNQSNFYALNLGANNRLNTVYMVSYFIGGSLGTFLGAWAWQYAQWNGVFYVGTIFASLAMIAHLLLAKKIIKN